MTALRVIPPEPIVCWPWSTARLVFDGPFRGGACDRCARPVALSPSAGHRLPVCIYCAMDEGLIALEDKPLSGAETHPVCVSSNPPDSATESSIPEAESDKSRAPLKNPTGTEG